MKKYNNEVQQQNSFISYHVFGEACAAKSAILYQTTVHKNAKKTPKSVRESK